jgi:hypothetical protein
MTSYASAGSQRWLQIAAHRRPELLRAALRRAGALGPREAIEWKSPTEVNKWREYRDGAALSQCGIGPNLKAPLSSFWPARGPVWDALGVTSEGLPVLVEAKAHIAEAASPGTKATPDSLVRINRSLEAARRYYAPRARAGWSGHFYQYANRLAHLYFLRKLNGIPARLVFLYFVNADDVKGPTSEAEWRGAVRLIHAVLGLPAHLENRGVYEAFVDARLLTDAS